MSGYPQIPSRQENLPAYRIDTGDLQAVRKIKGALLNLLALTFRPETEQLIILCIGTDRSTGDALGPLAGSRLKLLRPRNAIIFGTLEEPVHAVNLAETSATIRACHPSPYIIAIDACLGKTESVGCVDIGAGPALPGAGVNKALPAVGNVYINGVVNVGGFLEYFVLQNTRLSLVVRMAETISRGLYFALQNLPGPEIRYPTKAAR
ncbi:MAG: spore protease YyaC [Firmicutes bacterium]|nr:spore protease YyaC [Bacillota bacterium]